MLIFPLDKIILQYNHAIFFISLEKLGKRNEELKRADVVILTYACDEPSSLTRLSAYWLRELEELEVDDFTYCTIISSYEWGINGQQVVISLFIIVQLKVPVIVVGCKLDLRDENQQMSLENLMTQLLQQYGEIATCMECSAATLYQVYCLSS